MSQGKVISTTKRAQRISTKYPKNNVMFFRYSDFVQQCLLKYRMENGLDFATNPQLLEGIIKEWFEMKTIQEFQKDDPDLMIKMKKQEDKTYWIDYIYDNECNIGEIRALRGACNFIIDYRENKITHK